MIRLVLLLWLPQSLVVCVFLNNNNDSPKASTRVEFAFSVYVAWVFFALCICFEVLRMREREKKWFNATLSVLPLAIVEKNLNFQEKFSFKKSSRKKNWKQKSLKKNREKSEFIDCTAAVVSVPKCLFLRSSATTYLRFTRCLSFVCLRSRAIERRLYLFMCDSIGISFMHHILTWLRAICQWQVNITWVCRFKIGLEIVQVN